MSLLDYVTQLPPNALDALEAEATRRLEAYRAQRLFFALYPAETATWDGPSILKGLVQPGQTLHARDLYPKHLEFFRVGHDYRERCFLAANRVGKTFGGGGYELSCHLSGLYPDWWEGRRFEQPVSAWAAGKTNETTRDIVQLTLLGEVTYDGQRKVMDGRGIVPGHLLDAPKWKQGVSDLVDTIKIRHASGGWSVLGFKSYDQGRGAFEGTGQHVIWFDEEPPADVYGEALIRTATMKGLIYVTFTPLAGLSDVVMQFLPAEMRLSEK